MNRTRQQAPVRGGPPGPQTTRAPGAPAVENEATAAATVGNAAALGGPLADRMPDALDLEKIGLSATLAGNTTLTGGWNPLQTTSNTQVWLEITGGRLKVSFWPPLLVDAQWPMSNVEWHGLEYDFTTGQIARVNLENSQWLAFGTKGFVDDAIREWVNNVVGGTALGRPGYDPLRDPDVGATLRSLQANLTKGSATGGGGGDAGDLGPEDLSGITPSAGFRTTEEIVQGTGAGGVKIPAGTGIEAYVRLRGTAEQLAQSGVDQVDSISLRSDGIVLMQGDEPIAKLQSVTVLNGGQVRVDRFEPLGKLKEYGEVESGLRGLFALFQLAAASQGANTGPISTNVNPDLVNGMAEGQMEKALQDALRSLLETHHAAVPGYDLRQVLGMGAPR